MKKIKLSKFIEMLEKLKEQKGDVEIYPSYHHDETDSLVPIRRVSVLSAAACEKFRGQNFSTNAPKTTLFLVFEE